MHTTTRRRHRNRPTARHKVRYWTRGDKKPWPTPARQTFHTPGHEATWKTNQFNVRAFYDIGPSGVLAVVTQFRRTRKRRAANRMAAASRRRNRG